MGPFGLEPKGTMAVRALPLARALSARGHACELLLPPWSNPQDSGREWRDAGVYVHNIRLPHPIPLLGHAIITARLLLRILHTRPDVVHCFKPKGYAGLIAWALRVLRRLGLTQMRQLLDADDWEGLGGWNDVEPYPGWQKAVFAWQEKWGFLHCDALTVASSALQTIAWSLGVPPTLVHHVPNGFVEERVWTGQTDDQQRSATCHELGLAPGPVLLLYSRLWDFCLPRLMRIVARVRARVSDAQLLVVGTGIHGEERALADLVQASGLGDAVVMAGWVEPVDLPGYFYCADVALFPLDDTLINRARSSVKLVDLLAAGVPVVAEAVGQVTEYIEDGESGFLVAPCDENAFADAVIRVLSSPELRTAISQKAREAMEARFTWGHLAKQVETIYASVSDSALR